MGPLYLARQIALNRKTVLQTLSPALGADGEFIRRFIHAAYSAAHLGHPNLARIYDVGFARDTWYVSIEHVDGQDLAAATRSIGRIDARTAALYVLQAARGVAFVHDQGLTHRDVKPQNLLLDQNGIVKLSRFGLLNPDENAAGPYTSPEQTGEAGQADQRSDIYSLGCTLYHLLTGQPPFTGKTPQEFAVRHLRQPPRSPDAVVTDMPKDLSDLVLKMMAKRPEDRYPKMAAVIAALEQFSGPPASGVFTPKPAQIEAIQMGCAGFNSVPTAALRRYIIIAFGAAALAACYFGAYFGIASITLLVLTFLAYQVARGWVGQNEVYLRWRQFTISMPVLDWIGYVALLAFVGLAIWVSTWWFAVGIIFLVAMTLATAFRSQIDATVAQERKKSLNEIQQMLRTLRLNGLEENALRHFVFAHTGRNWEEFYEALFGYQTKLQARHLWLTDDAPRRRRCALWRDPIIRGIRQRLTALRQARYRQLLINLQSIPSAGSNPEIAAQQAQDSAAALMRSAVDLRLASILKIAQTALPPAQAQPAARKFLLWVLPPATAASLQMPEFSETTSPLKHLSGRAVRLALALLILAGLAIWWLQSARHGSSDPLRIAHLPDLLTQSLSTWWAAVPACLLLGSLFFSGEAMGALVILASLLGLLGNALLAQVYLPPPPLWTAPAAAFCIWLFAINILRQRRGMAFPSPSSVTHVTGTSPSAL